MKQTAGLLRLDLAQYRELAAFAQFASDLDASTRKQLDRGRRLMEVIKQGILSPLPVVKQVAIIYAGVNGFLDDVAVADIKRFEEALGMQLDTRYQDFTTLFNKTLAMTDEIKSQLNAILNEVKASLKA